MLVKFQTNFRGATIAAAILWAAAASAQSFPTAPPAQNSAPSTWSSSPTQYPAQSQSPTPAVPRVAPPALAPSAWQDRQPTPRPAIAPKAHAFSDKSGTVPLGAAKRMRLDIDVGNVFVRTDATGQVSYRVRIETDGNEANAREILDSYRVRATSPGKIIVLSARVPTQNYSGSLWVTYELSVPRNLHVEISTGVGNIEMQDSNSAVQLETGGGNITVGNVSEAKLDTKGGHIVIGNVAGDLSAKSGGGHITAANIGGDADLNTSGGHIHAGSIGGQANLETGGGNISVDRASSEVTATSAAGQISFGEAAGAINAHTSGGGIRVLRVAGPMQLESHGGSILLTQVENEVHASTGTGSITAWFSPGGKIINASDLAAKQGDIVIYVPRSLAITIDATVESPEHRIVADPGLPMKVNYVTNAAGKQQHGECELNGGGKVLHLRAAAGNIHLIYADSMKLQSQAIEQQLRLQTKQFQEQMKQMAELAQTSEVTQYTEQTRMQIQQVMQELAAEQDRMARDVFMPMPALAPMPPMAANGQMPAIPATTTLAPMAPTATMPAMSHTPSPNLPSGNTPVIAPMPPEPPPAMTEIWWMKLDQLWYGGVKVDAADQQKRCTYAPRPEYPDEAQQAGIEGSVELRVLIDRDGHVEDVRGISGEQVLVNSAANTVRKWRYKPMMLDGKPVPVVTTVRLEFRLM
jgi:TonB family protein